VKNKAASLVAACPAVWDVAFFDLEAVASLVDVASASLGDLPAEASLAWET
jgi:hypothetical protein